MNLNYTVEGRTDPDAPVVLFAHSIGTSRDLWLPQIPAFASAYRIVRYDARGHGGSPVPEGEYSIDALGRDALEVLDAVGVARAHVVGLSLGGLTAMWLAINAPDRVGRIVLANTAARIGTRAQGEERIAIVRANGLATVAHLAMPRWFSTDFRARDGDTVERYRSLLASCAPHGYIGCFAVLRDTDLRDDLPRISAPTLIIAGTHDPATTVADAELLRDRIPGARMIELPTAHLSNIEQPEAFSSAVLDFLETSG
jgi:3-oxoadipate enol-lactonase